MTSLFSCGVPYLAFCVVAVGLFYSIGWSNTFSLAIEGLGELKSQASSLLVLVIHLDSDKTFSIITAGLSAENRYAQSASLNGLAWPRNYLHHADITRCGSLELVMGSKPSLWGTHDRDLPPSLTGR